jgi:hypothetical protein
VAGKALQAVSYSSACSKGQHGCDKGYCACPCHEDGVKHSAKGLFDLIVKSSGPWVEQALCGSVKHPDDWFPEAGSRRGTKVELNAWRPAKRVCGRCPVRRECLTSALVSESSGLAAGVWGGLTPSERHDRRFKDLPLSERVDMLMLKFEAKAHLLLSNRERRVS